MNKYRIKVEVLEGEKQNGDLFEDGLVCEGFALVSHDKDASVLMACSPLNLVQMFSNEPVLQAAAKAGEAIDNIVKTANRDDLFGFLEALKKF